VNGETSFFGCKRVAFFGLGKMGLPMARRLYDAGVPVVGFDLSRPARDAFAQSGGAVATNAGEAAERSDVLISMLPDG
jgi:3-hydroxyisobutyrate dehydrogenase-like beta-hydroxyacid dehydrogenase